MKKTLTILLALTTSACVIETSGSKRADTTTAVAPAAPVYTADSVISVPFDSTSYADTAGLGSQIGNQPPLANDTAFKHISGPTVSATLSKFPARIPTRGPAVLQIEVLLDRSGFSPGIIDGTWGANAAKALAWFRIANGMDSTGTSVATGNSKSKGAISTSIDQATYQKLVEVGQSTPLVTSYQVTADDVKGPFIQLPHNVYEQAKLPCLCYTSAAEELSEKFHTSEQLLQQLNPGVDLKSIAAGTTLQVPNVANQSPQIGGNIAKLVISKKGYWLHAVDASGKVLMHFPSTLGAGYDPSPTGDFKISGISHNPSFNYQPALMAEVPDTRPTAKLKPGPNSPVGVVWMQLSKPHYGIHGTSSPETIGYANSHGCVRLTNWDAEELASLVKPGTPVQFE